MSDEKTSKQQSLYVTPPFMKMWKKFCKKHPEAQADLESAIEKLYQNGQSAGFDKKTLFNNLYSFGFMGSSENARVLLFKEETTGLFIGGFVGKHGDYDSYFQGNKRNARALDAQASSFNIKKAQQLVLNTDIPVDNLSCMGLVGRLGEQGAVNVANSVPQEDVDALANEVLKSSNAEGFFVDRQGRMAFLFDRTAQAVVSVCDADNGGRVFQGDMAKLEGFFSSQLSRVASIRKHVILGSGLQGLMDEFTRQRNGDTPKLMAAFEGTNELSFSLGHTAEVPQSRNKICLPA